MHRGWGFGHRQPQQCSAHRPSTCRSGNEEGLGLLGCPGAVSSQSLCSPCSPSSVGEAPGRPCMFAGGIYTGCPGLLHVALGAFRIPRAATEPWCQSCMGVPMVLEQLRRGQGKPRRLKQRKESKSVQQQMTQPGAAPERAGTQQEVYQRQGRGRGAKRCRRRTCKGLQVRARCLSD